MIVLDTHVWIWWVNGHVQLSSAANQVIEQAVLNRAIYISSISAWEVALLVKRGRLKLTTGVTDWIAKSERLPFVTFCPVDNRIATRSVVLPDEIQPDPADRIIIATALILGFPLVTKDERIRETNLLTTIW